jgi:apolipoprotein N-acyltransferase
VGAFGTAQHNNPLIIQIASLTGAYGVSFLIVMVNAAIAGLVVFISSHKKALRRGEQRKGATKAGMVVLSTVALTSLLFAVGFGVFQLSLPISGERIKVSVVQGNIEQAKKWDRKYANMIMKTYTDLSFQAATDGPMLIVWPETATPKAINLDQEVFRNVSQIVQETSIPILLGSSQQQKYGKKESFKTRYTNSAFLMIPREGRLEMQRYDKIRLLPFSEYLPMRGTVPWSVIKVPDFTGYAAGDKFAVFKVGDVEFGVTICWENIFPELVREFVKNGSQFIVNITNEARFGESAAPYQFLAMSIMRAVENRVFVVRSANTGISCFIDPCGRVLDRVKEINGPDIFVQGVLTQSIVPSSRKTLYTRYGNWLVWLSMLWSVAILIVSFCRKPQMI